MTAKKHATGASVEPLSPAQRDAARRKSVAARTERARVKAQVREGVITVEQVIYQEAQEDAISRLKVVDLLRSIPGVGAKRAEAIMEELHIAESRRLKGMGVHQKAALVDYVNRRSLQIPLA